MEELPYWTETLRGQFAKLPVDFPQGDNRFRSIETLNEVFPADATAALLTDAHQPYRTEIGDLLLTALTNLLVGRSNARRILVYVEGHGRDLLPDGPDVSRTVGWFTAKYPLVLELVGDDVGTQIKHIKEQIRAVPHRGNGYGVLRYLSDGEKTLALDRTIEPQVSFNYLGQVTVDGSALFQAVPEGLDNDSIHPDLDMRQDLSFTGIVQHGRLNIAISYSRERFRRLTVETLLREYVDALTLLIRHCMERTTVELTPSDVDYGGFATIGEMDKFLDKLESS
jgi:non-ribosomal peptide synthase protein (TIGR01720 family)